jgi:hypothetical protein
MVRRIRRSISGRMLLPSSDTSSRCAYFRVCKSSTVSHTLSLFGTSPHALVPDALFPLS